MKKLNVPSLQHLARNWRNDPQKIEGVLVRLAENPPIFNYAPLFTAVSDMLVFKHPYEQILEGMHRGVKREGVRDNFLEVLPLIHSHFENITPDFVQAVNVRKYPAGRGLLIPFRPPLIYGVGGQIYFPWFSFWRSNPLANKRLSLFVTLVYEVLLQDPDLEEAKFEILDFSAPKSKAPRELHIIDARDIPQVPEEEKIKMLAVFADGFFRAQAQLAKKDRAPKGDEDRYGSRDDRQPPLFDGDW